jgi:nucleotide-binding universal stress UspA family protein
LLSVWEPLIDGGERGPDEATQQLASRAVERARDLGLDTEPRWQADAADVCRAIVEAAEREQADLIVTGGSVAEGVMRHADRPVLVVPQAQSATARRAAVPARAVPSGGMRVQVVPLED